MFGKVLVPIDGTDVADGILPYVSQLARAAEIPILLHTVVDTKDLAIPESAGSFEPMPAINWGEVEESLKARAEVVLNSTVQRLADEGLEATATVTVGDPSEEIVKVAADAGCGLIAMSTHGRNALARGILGSVTDRVLHSSSVPVLTITPERANRHKVSEDTATKKILAPLDGSESAERAMSYVEELAQAMSLEVVLARVVPVDHPAYSVSELGAILPDFTEQRVQEAEKYLERTANNLTNAGLEVQSQVLMGTPGPALVDFARQTPQSMVVMTTRGRSGLARWVLGSVAEALIRASGDPVLVIPPED